jgi:hypothetical protein
MKTTSPVIYTVIQVTGIKPVEISNESYKKGTYSKMSKFINFKISEKKKLNYTTISLVSLWVSAGAFRYTPLGYHFTNLSHLYSFL